ncbi:hypothetical protein [Marinicella meishanensis]|uniref:hypothetical protein n=1 Tax=Marinicella meishanensis TaxID=2873263 RepID=UPI001CBFB364|nr:hypothetical protein [Marinicella sp. NBU2979]
MSRVWVMLMGVCMAWLVQTSALAVQVNHQGLGNVLLVPYYTVNNDLNTMVALTNTTPHSKAIKINIREGLNGDPVLSYNVYLAGHDAWTFALVPSVSLWPGFENEPAAMQVTGDRSCAPNVNRQGEHFWINRLAGGDGKITRIREGFIEIIEMGDLTGAAAAAVTFGDGGQPTDCAAIAARWQHGGSWHVETGGDPAFELVPGSGGLMAETHLLEVRQGINYNYGSKALGDFLAPGQTAHVAPGDVDLSLDAAHPEAWVDDPDRSHHFIMDTGYDAVSMVLAQYNTHTTYTLEPMINAKTELVFTFPTRRFYLAADYRSARPPFLQNIGFTQNSRFCANEHFGGSIIIQDFYDRESQSVTVNTAPGIQPRYEYACGSVFVQALHTQDVEFELFVPPDITGSHNFKHKVVLDRPRVTDNGFVNSFFISSALWSRDTPWLATDQHSGDRLNVLSLPYMSIALTRFSNGAAAKGLLAQYGGATWAQSETLWFFDR